MKPKPSRQLKSAESRSSPQPEPEPEPEQIFHGVSWNAGAKTWQCQVPYNGQLKFVGLFDDKLEAAYAHDAAAHESFGSRVHCKANGVTLNFPTSCDDCRTWALACMGAGEPHEAADWLEQALEDESEPLDDQRPLVAYELAGCYATCLDSSTAIIWLSDAIKWGLGTVGGDADALEPHEEPMFASLWRDSRFLTLCARLDEKRWGPAHREEARLVRRHRAARASACVTAAATAIVEQRGDELALQAEAEHAQAPTDGDVNECSEVKTREEDMDLFFEFWSTNVDAMNDLFGRLATRLIPVDLIRATLGRVAGGLQLQAGIEDYIADMVGLSAGGTSNIGYGGAIGGRGAPSLFQAEVERVGLDTSSKLSAASRHRSLQTEALCRPMNLSQVPKGMPSTVVVKVVERDVFLEQCAVVASAWSAAAARNARGGWINEFAEETAAAAAATVVSSPEASSAHVYESVVVSPSSAGAAAGLTEADVNAALHASPKQLKDVSVSMPAAATPPSGTGQQRWQDATLGLPDEILHGWAVGEVSTWLRSLGFSDTVVGKAQAARMSGNTLVGPAPARADGAPDAMAIEDRSCDEIAEMLGLKTLGSRKLLAKAIRALRHKAGKLDATAAPPQPAATAGELFTPFASSSGRSGDGQRLVLSISESEEHFLRRMDLNVHGDEAERVGGLAPEASSFDLNGNDSNNSSPPSQAKSLGEFSFGDISCVTRGL